MHNFMSVLKKRVSPFTKNSFENIFVAIILIVMVGFVISEAFKEERAYKKVSEASVNLSLEKAFAAHKVELPSQFKSVTCSLKYLACRVKDTSDAHHNFDAAYFLSQNDSIGFETLSAYEADFSFELTVANGEIRSTIQNPEKLHVRDAAAAMKKMIPLLIPKRDKAYWVSVIEKQNTQSWGST